MAVQSDLQQDARKRADEYNREYVATEVAPRPATTNGSVNGVTNHVVDKSAGDILLALLEKSAQTLRHTAESVEIRGLKLLLKVVAQERVAMYNSLRQALGRGAVNPLDASRKPAGRSLKQGMQEIQSSMTVQKQGRENVALNHLVAEEDALVAAYSSLLGGAAPSPLQEMLETQRSRIANFDARLQAVGGGIEPIVARVFDSRLEGESAVKRLQEAGLAASQIDSTTISRVTNPVLRTTVVPASPKKAMAAGATSGGLIGVIIGAALATFVWMAPGSVGWVTAGPWSLLFGAIIIGAVFGTVFGFFIGQNQREDDLMVTADGLVNGDILVVAYPHPDQVALVEDLLQVYHARELNR